MTFKSCDDYTDLEKAECVYYEAHKDAYGFRDRSDRSSWTLADYDRETEKLCRVINDEEERERQLCLQRQREFEGQIESLISLGASDRAAAVRWWFESNGAEPGWLADPRYHTQEIEHVAYGILPIPLWRFVLPEIIPGYRGI